jgi:hypothetical protein
MCYPLLFAIRDSRRQATYVSSMIEMLGGQAQPNNWT